MNLTFTSRPPTAPAGRWPQLLRGLGVLLLAAWAVGCASLPANSQRPASSAYATPDDTAMGKLAQARRSQSGAKSDSGFRLLDSVDAAYAARLALIEGAQRTLDLQYYAVHADSSTEQLLERVRAAAQRGVRVRILLDDFNTVGTDAQVLRLAFLPNIELRLFNPVAGSRSSLIGRIVTSLHDVERLQKRMHNKLFIADNAWGIAGGRNLGDAYFGRGGDSNFVDLDILAAGRIVRDMSASFDSYWNNELAYPVQTLLEKDDLERLRKPTEAANAVKDVSRAAANPGPSTPAATVTAGASVLPDVTATAVQGDARRPMPLERVSLTWAPSVLMVDKPGKVGPGDDEADAGDTLVDGLLAIMGRARQDVLIISPYFVPGEQMMKVFADLRARKVRIRVLTNSLASNDAPAAHAGYARYRKKLLAMGIEVHEMRSDQEGSLGGFGSGVGTRSAAGSGVGSGPGGSKSGTSRASLHSKAVVIDGRLSVIGSMNLDLRSKLKNSEVALVIRSAPLAAQATQLVENSFAHGAYLLQLNDGSLLWKAPPGADFKDATSEPEADLKLRLLVDVLGSFAPEEML
ncbi:MAG: phospholipase D family protein [Ramlibacter sp.]